MRFKVYYDEKIQGLNINCLTFRGGHEIVVPENTNDHVQYPIPIKFKSEIKEYLLTLLDENLSQEFRELIELQKELITRRQELVHKLREDVNPKIVDRCKQFKLDFPEEFI